MRTEGAYLLSTNNSHFLPCTPPFLVPHHLLLLLVSYLNSQFWHWVEFQGLFPGHRVCSRACLGPVSKTGKEGRSVCQWGLPECSATGLLVQKHIQRKEMITRDGF